MSRTLLALSLLMGFQAQAQQVSIRSLKAFACSPIYADDAIVKQYGYDHPHTFLAKDEATAVSLMSTHFRIAEDRTLRRFGCAGGALCEAVVIDLSCKEIK